MTIIQSRRVFKTIVITLVVATALMAYSAMASSDQSTTTTTTVDPHVPAPAVISPYGRTNYRGLNNNNDGYTETTTTTDQNGDSIKTRRDVDIDDDKTTLKTTVVGPDGMISRTKTEIEQK